MSQVEKHGRGEPCQNAFTARTIDPPEDEQRKTNCKSIADENVGRPTDIRNFNISSRATWHEKHGARQRYNRRDDRHDRRDNQCTDKQAFILVFHQWINHWIVTSNMQKVSSNHLDRIPQSQSQTYPPRPAHITKQTTKVGASRAGRKKVLRIHQLRGGPILAVSIWRRRKSSSADSVRLGMTERSRLPWYMM